MTQHDQNIANQSFPATRADLNNALASLFSLSSGTSAPSTTVAGMLWYDTTNAIIKQRNAADSGWITLFAIGKQGLIDQDGSTVYAADSVGSDSYAITLSPAPTAYANGQVFRFKAGTANTGACTLNVNALGAKTIKKAYNIDLADNDIAASQIVAVIYDGTNFQLLSPVNTGIYPIGFQGSARAVYASTTTYTRATIHARDSGNTTDLRKTGSTTVDITTTGLNGLARSTSNLTGTIAYNNASATVTGTGTAFTTDYVVGDTIWDQTNSVVVGTISVIGSNTSITLAANFSGTNQTGASHRRGARAGLSWWYEYAITDGTTPGLILSNRNVAGGQTLVDLPSGYTLSRQLPFAIRLNSSTTIMPFRHMPDGWVFYLDGSIDQVVLSGGTAVNATAVSCTSYVPAHSKMALLDYNTGVSSTTNGVLYIRDGDSGGTGRAIANAAQNNWINAGSVISSLNATQQFNYYWANQAQTASFYIAGWKATEVA